MDLLHEPHALEHALYMKPGFFVHSPLAAQEAQPLCSSTHLPWESAARLAPSLKPSPPSAHAGGIASQPSLR